MSEGGVRSSTDPEEAFMTLSNELRLEILLALWEAPGFSLPFSELQKAVGERDSGTFTYSSVWNCLHTRSPDCVRLGVQ